jgi:hypothetical protein
MRLGSLFLVLLLLAGISVAQDTSFSSGPQYLITTSDTMFLRPISTPTLSFGPSLPLAPPIETGAGTEAQVSATPAAIQTHADLARVYWGGPATSEIEITSEEPAVPLPASLINIGVAGMTNAQSLREQGYGVPLGETAAYWKTHKPHATHVFTNRDVERLHGM